MTSYTDLLNEAKKTLSYWVEKAKIDFSITVNDGIKKSNVSKKELAKRIETSPAYISQILAGNKNLTIEQMVKIARALGGDFNVEITFAREKENYNNILAANDVSVTSEIKVISNKVIDMKEHPFWANRNNITHEKETIVLAG